MRTIRTALRAPTPVDFLVTGTMLAAVGLARTEPKDQPGWVGLVDSFVLTDLAETTAVLHVMAALTDDDLLRARILRELASRRQPMPTTVTGLAELRVRAAWTMIDPLGDGDNYVLGLEWPGGDQLTFVVYVDHNLGTLVKDAFLVPERVEHVVEHFVTVIAESGEGAPHPEPADVADCRACLEQALVNLDLSPISGHEADYVDDDEGGMWPACRTLLDFVITRMPEGGEGYASRHELGGAPSAEAMEGFAQAFEGFAASPEAAPFRDDTDGERYEATAEAAVHLLAFALAHSGDPLRWSAVTVEISLVDSLAYAPGVSERALDAVAEVLPALIRYAHRVRGVDPRHTESALEAVTRYLVDFEALRREPEAAQERRAGGMLLDELRSPGALLWNRLIEIVGDPEALDGLDPEPLPDEPLDLAEVPADVHPALLEVSEHLDRLAASAVFPELDVEFRTACRRFLGAAAKREPAVFRRRAKAVNTAAAVAWIVGRNNELVGMAPAPVGTGLLMEWFGIAGPPSSRADSLSRAFGAAHSPWPGVALGSPDVLVSRMRATLIRRRDTDRW